MIDRSIVLACTRLVVAAVIATTLIACSERQSASAPVATEAAEQAEAEGVNLEEALKESEQLKGPIESVANNPQWVTLPGGGQVQYEVFGESGPFVFLGSQIYLTAPMPGSAAVYRGYIAGLSDRYRVIVADWPKGMGKSTATGVPALTADQAAAEILAIADAAGADQFAWWGYSFGGAVGLQLAARTDRLSALVVGGYPPMWQPSSDMLLAVHQAKDQMEAAKLNGTPGYLLNRASIQFYTSVGETNQLDLLDNITAPRLVYHDVDDTVEIGGMVHDLSKRTRAGADTLKARGWEIQWMDTGLAHYGMNDYQKNLDAFAPFLDKVLLEK